MKQARFCCTFVLNPPKPQVCMFFLLLLELLLGKHVSNVACCHLPLSVFVMYCGHPRQAQHMKQAVMAS